MISLARRAARRLGVLRGCAVCIVSVLSGCSSLNQTNPFSESHEWFGDGLPCLVKVSDRFYTGGQPSRSGFARLKTMGVRTVINVRESETSNKRDLKACEELGFEYVRLPIPCGGPPSDEAVNQFFRIV